MIHSKLDGLMGGAERLARVAAGAYRAATTARTAPSGSASYQNADGTRTVIGPVSGDGTMATHVGDVEPPGRPVGVAGASSAGVVYVAWGGGIDGGVPADFDHVTCYISVDGVDEAVGTLNEAGIVSTVPMATATTVEVWATAEDDACLADGTPAHNVSAPSERATVAVTQAADPSSLAALEQSVGLAVSTATDAKTAADAARAAADAATAETRDLVTLRIDSSRGTVFKNSEISTVLTVRCWKRGEEISTRTALRDAMGDQTARIRWWVLREGDSSWVALDDADAMLSADGFTLTVRPTDVEVKCTFKAEVVTG